MNRRLIAIARKETIQILRDPLLAVFAFGLPLVMMLLFGYAITLDIKKIGAVVVDPHPTSESRRLVAALTSSNYFQLKGTYDSTGPVDRMLDSGAAGVALVFPVDYDTRLARGESARIGVMIDGADNNKAMLSLGYLRDIFIAEGVGMLRLKAEKGGLGGVVEQPIEAQTRVWYNPSLESRNFIVPGEIAAIMGMIAVLLTALCIAREHERGTFEQLVVTPLKAHELIIGKMAPYYLIALVDTAATLAMGYYVFDVPIVGSLLDIFLASAVFVFAGLSQGIVISIVARSQVVAMQMAILSSLLPGILLSGFIFPISSMPKIIAAFSNIIPTRHFLEILRALQLKGVGLELLTERLAFLAIVGLVLFGAAFKKFNKRVE